MDPTIALRVMIDALRELQAKGDREYVTDFKDAAAALGEWLDGGGFPPDVVAAIFQSFEG